MRTGSSLKWLEHVSFLEALVIRVGGLILISIFIVKAIMHELGR
jgi:hypothetical protein